MRTKKEITAIYERQADTVYRVCMSFMRNTADAEDLTQEAFMRLISADPVFKSERHERAWLIVTASNQCKNALKSRERQHDDIAEHEDIASWDVHPDPVTEAVMELPEDYKTAVLMYYYEGLSIKEIAKATAGSVPAVKARLMRARRMLKEKMGEDYES